jgi:hypothetical protein
MEVELAEATNSLGHELATVKSSLSAEISSLAATLDRSLRSPSLTVAGDPTAPSLRLLADGAFGPSGHRSELLARGMTSASYSSPPSGGMSLSSQLNSSVLPVQFHQPVSPPDSSYSASRVELPSFDGSNPKLRRRHCDEYFIRWGTPEELKVSYASSLFTAAVATWLESFL